MFDTNNEIVVDKISKFTSGLSEMSVLVKRCKIVLGLNPTFNVCFLRRQVNEVAHALARATPSLPSI